MKHQSSHLQQTHVHQPIVLTVILSTKGSCTTDALLGDHIGEISQCELFVEDGFTPRVVAIKKVFEWATTLFNVAIPPYVVKVTVEKIRVVYGHVPLPTNEVITVIKTFKKFIA